MQYKLVGVNICLLSQLGHVGSGQQLRERTAIKIRLLPIILHRIVLVGFPEALLNFADWGHPPKSAFLSNKFLSRHLATQRMITRNKYITSRDLSLAAISLVLTKVCCVAHCLVETQNDVQQCTICNRYSLWHTELSVLHFIYIIFTLPMISKLLLQLLWCMSRKIHSVKAIVNHLFRINDMMAGTSVHTSEAFRKAVDLARSDTIKSELLREQLQQYHLCS